MSRLLLAVSTLTALSSLGCAARSPAPAIAHPTAGPEAAPGDARLDAAAKAAVEKSPFLGLSVLVLDHGKVVFEGTYGFTTLDHATHVDTHTRFAIGSITKQITAAAVLSLVDAHRVALTDPVSKYVPAVDARI